MHSYLKSLRGLSEVTIVTGVLAVLFVGLLVWGLTRGPDLMMVATAAVMIALLGGLAVGSMKRDRAR